jgi:Gram-negative porin
MTFLKSSFVNSAGKLGLASGTALALAIGGSAPASAASMHDAGLGKRVSTLEAEVRMLKARVKALEDRKVGVPDKLVQSGNSRVKVTLYGQVNRAVRFHFTKGDTSIAHVDNSNSSTRLGVLARGRLFPDVTITGLIELATRDNPRDLQNDFTDGGAFFRTRHTDLYITHSRFGSLHIGHGSMASDGANLFTLNGTSHIWSNDAGDDGVGYALKDGIPGFIAPGPVGGPILPTGFINGHANFVDVRENRIMYRSPRIYGFEFRVAHGEGDMVDFGLRYLGTPFGKDFRILGAFGYQLRSGSGAVITGAGGLPGRTIIGASVYGASLSVLHVPTGISVSGSWAHTAIRINVPGLYKGTSWSADIGWQGNIWAMGKTAISAHFGKTDHAGRLDPPGPAFFGDTHGWHFGVAVNQRVDAAATDIYAGYRYLDGKFLGGALNAMHVIIVGARIKF